MALLLPACVSQPHTADLTAIELAPAFSRSGDSELADQWWHVFNDPDLDRLIETALRDNFSLKTSWDRLSQARATYAKSRAGLFPNLTGEGGATHSRDVSGGNSEKTDTVLLGLSASYEIDLWGRIDSEAAAARLDMEATRADLEAAAMSLTAEVASTWYQLVQENVSLTLLDAQIATNSKALAVISAQFRTGQAPLADVLQQRQLVESGRSDQALLLAQRAQTAHQLSILLGQVPGETAPASPPELIALPDLPATGIPAELIRSRPDIRSLFLAIKAADERVAAAIADRYPAVRLTASLETLQGSASTMFSDYLASLVAGLTAPLVDGGARRAEVERTQGVALEKLHAYGQGMLTAIGEVEDALQKEEHQQRYLQSLQRQLDLASQTMDQVKERYLHGVENYERVLTALTSLQSLQQSLIAAKKDLLLIRIALCRAIGTGWNYSATPGQGITA